MTDTTGPRTRADDAGFTLVEMMVAVAIVSIVMLALGALFVATAGGTKAQGSQQTASRLVTDGMDRVHALSGSDVVKGRDRAATTTQWNNPVKGVGALLTGLSAAWDATAVAGAGATAVLPTTAVGSTVGGLAYQQNWYVASCFQTTSGTCLAATAPGTVALYDVVVAVTWKDKACAGGTCSSVASTLVQAGAADPRFNTNISARPPQIAAVDDVVTDLTLPVSVPFAVSGGAAPLGVTVDPPTLALDASGSRLVGTASVLGTTKYVVTVTDQFGLAAQTPFSLTVNPLPTVAAQAVPLLAGVLSTATLVSTGGTAPLIWAATGLPQGLALDPATGIVTGQLTTLSTTTTRVTVTDAVGRTASNTVTWTLLQPLRITSPTAASVVGLRTVAVTIVPAATGGSGGTTWSVTGLPGGLTFDPATGTIAGRPAAGIFTVTLTARDTGNRSATFSWKWTIL